MDTKTAGETVRVSPATGGPQVAEVRNSGEALRRAHPSPALRRRMDRHGTITSIGGTARAGQGPVAVAHMPAVLARRVNDGPLDRSIRSPRYRRRRRARLRESLVSYPVRLRHRRSRSHGPGEAYVSPGRGACGGRPHRVAQLRSLARFLSPIGLAFAAIGPALIPLVFEYGAFGSWSTERTAAALDGLSVGFSSVAVSFLSCARCKRWRNSEPS
jgi:hypothetical protein